MTTMAAVKRRRSDLDPDRVHPTQCAGTNREGNPCERSPLIGSGVCYTHGGAAPHVRAAADRRIAELSAQREARAILASMLLDLDAEPVTDPAALVMRLAARSESGFVEAAKRIDAAITAGVEPSETDLSLFKFFGGMASKLGLDMTRLQIGAAAMARYGPSAGLDEAESAELGSTVSVDLPDVSSIVAAVLETEHRLETDRLVKVEAARSMGATQGQLPAGLQVVQAESEAESA